VSIYLPCDIRGSVDTELTPKLYRRWGLILGQQVPVGEKFVAGGDGRASTPAYRAALVEGLCQAGVDLVDLGTIPTPMIYYAKRRLAAAGCAIVTASHRPAQLNGLKWMIGDRPPTRRDIGVLKRAAGQRSIGRNGRTATSPRGLDVSFDYVAWLQETWFGAPPMPRPIVLEVMHGTWARRARRYLQAIFPHSIFSAIHDEPDGSFAGRVPDCARVEQLEDLCRAVYQQRAALGIAFDGDGDRVAFVDDEGNPLTAEETTWVLLQSIADDLPAERFVYDLKFSNRIPEAAGALGAQPLAERSGHAFLRSRMLSSDALFGAEISGHYFFRALGGGDDGLYSACRMIAFLARTGRSLSDLRRACPRVHVTPDLRVAMKARGVRAVIERVRQCFAGYPQSALDGVRVEFPDGWALVRSSITQPAVTFRFEAANWTGLTELVWGFCETLPEIGDALWARFHEAMGLPDAEP